MNKVSGRGERGQGLVETSLTLIVFFILVFGAIDVGRAVWNYNTLAQATREGTRYAIVHGANSSNPSGPGDDQDIKGVVETHGGSLGAENLTVTTEWPDGGNNRGSRVTVSSQYAFSPLFGFLGAINVNLSSSSTMQIQN